ncbi:MAG TPA: hypothetical protein VGD37_00400 [Kofleriaceae bacterium]|jgi:hypothetical protein
MLAGRLAKIYAALWHISDDDDRPGWVLYNNMGFEPGQAAMFMTHLADDRGIVTDDQPCIWVWRSPAPDPSDEPDLAGADLRELMALAHEHGHERSWRACTYEARSMPEERRAWANADAILRDLGFDSWSEFEDAKRFSLAEHVRRGTPETAPRDEAVDRRF